MYHRHICIALQSLRTILSGATLLLRLREKSAKYQMVRNVEVTKNTIQLGPKSLICPCINHASIKHSCDQHCN